MLSNRTAGCSSNRRPMMCLAKKRVGDVGRAANGTEPNSQGWREELTATVAQRLPSATDRTF
jgi:hypothetical protein